MVVVPGATIFTSLLITFNRLLLSTSAKNHEGGIDFGITVVFLFVLVFVRLFLLLTGLVSLGTAGSGVGIVEWYA